MSGAVCGAARPGVPVQPSIVNKSTTEVQDFADWLTNIADKSNKVASILDAHAFELLGINGPPATNDTVPDNGEPCTLAQARGAARIIEENLEHMLSVIEKI